MKLAPHQKIQWEIKPDGSVSVRPQPSALDLYGSLASKKAFPGAQEEKSATRRAVAKQAAEEGRTGRLIRP